MDVKFSATWDFVCCDKEGRGKWREVVKNLVVNEGLDAILNIMFHGSTQITTWYIALFESDSAPAEGNTYASPGVTETTAYDESTRPAFNEAAASSASITNSANKATFTFNDTKTIYGGMLVGGGTGATTKGNTDGGGTTFCQSRLDTAKSVSSEDVLSVTVTIESSAA
jgi:hypothetical protein